jgi:predicted acyl esterase
MAGSNDVGPQWRLPDASYGVVAEDVTLTMPDGVKLSATVGWPAHRTTGERATGPFPVIFQHSPYTSVPDDFFVQRGYIWVNVRPRGTGESEGVLAVASSPPSALNERGVPQDAEDARTLIAWAAGLPGSDGNVGQIGCSYPGKHAWDDAANIGPGSPLKASVLQCWGGGKGSLSHEQFVQGGVPTQFAASAGGVCALVTDVPETRAACMELSRVRSESALAGGPVAYVQGWSALSEGDLTADIARNGIPALIMTNWGDVNTATALWNYAQFQNAWSDRPLYAPMEADHEVTARYQILVGPRAWGHAVGVDKAIALQWFDTWLNDADTPMRRTQVGLHAFEERSERWVNLARYPMVGRYTTLYFGADQRLLPDAPDGGSGADVVRWDVPSAPDARVVYRSEVFTEGATLAGPISATLFASSTNTNLQLVLTLLDAAPDGTTAEISEYSAVIGSQRALDDDTTLSWADRDGRMIKPYIAGDRDEYLVPGDVYRFDVAMRTCLWSLAPGHELHLVVATQVPPEVCATVHERPYPCHNTAPQLATLPGGVYAVLHGAAHPSRVEVPLLPYDCYEGVEGGPTESSGGFTQPSDWITSSEHREASGR